MAVRALIVERRLGSLNASISVFAVSSPIPLIERNGAVSPFSAARRSFSKESNPPSDKRRAVFVPQSGIPKEERTMAYGLFLDSSTDFFKASTVFSPIPGIFISNALE